MQPLIIKPTEMTPEISFDASTGMLKMSGRGFTQKIISFYDPVLKWIDTYLEAPHETTTLDLKLEYINSASTMVIANIVKKLYKLQASGKKVTLNWHYNEEEDMLETGTEMANLLGVPFNFIAYTPT